MWWLRGKEWWVRVYSNPKLPARNRLFQYPTYSNTTCKNSGIPEPDFFNTRPITNLWFKGKIESLPEDTRYPKFQYPPEPDFSNTRDTRTRHLKIRVYPNPPEPDFFHTRPITTKKYEKKFHIHQDLESVEKWAVRLSTLSKIDAFKIFRVFPGNPGNFREIWYQSHILALSEYG